MTLPSISVILKSSKLQVMKSRKITDILNIQSSDLRSHTIPSSYNFGSFAPGGTLFREHWMKKKKKTRGGEGKKKKKKKKRVYIIY
jgi:hypothetical protein